MDRKVNPQLHMMKGKGGYGGYKTILLILAKK